MKKSALGMGIALALAAMVGCGGGGSSSGGSDDKKSSSSTATVSGVAVKGIVQQGIVTAIELDAGGAELGVVGTGVTGSTGQYRIGLNNQYQGGLIKLVLTADVNTRMICDSLTSCGGTEFGEALALPSGFTMNAVVAPVGGSVSGQITPLSHMVAARVLAQLPVDTETLNQAVSEINQLVGVNVKTVSMVDITDSTALASASADEKQLALFNAGLADLIINSGDINGTLGGLASSFADGAFDAGDAVTIAAILDAVATALDQLSAYPALAPLLDDAADDVQQVVDVINSQVVAGGFDPEPSSMVNASEVAQAKALITDARSFLTTIAEDYEDPMDAMAGDLDGVEEIINLETQVNLRLAGLVLDQVLTALDEQEIDLLQELNSPGSYQVAVVDGDGQGIGTVTAAFGVNDTGLLLNINGVVASDPSITIDLLLGTNLVEEKLSSNGGVIESFTTDSVELTLSGGVDAGSSRVDFNGVQFVFAYDDTVVIEEGSAGFDTASWFDTASLAGTVDIVVDQASFSGAIELELVTLDQGVARDNEQLNISHLLLDGAISTPSASTHVRLEFDMDNAAQFDLFAYLDGEAQITGSMIVEGLPESYENPGQRLATAFNQATGNTFQALPETFVWYGGTRPELWCTMSIDYLTQSGVGPFTFLYSQDSDEALQFTAQFFIDAYPLVADSLGYGDDLYYLDLLYMQYEEEGYRVVYQAYLSPVEETEDNFISGRLSMTAAVDSPQLPEATATIAITREQFKVADAVMTVAYGGQSYTLEVGVSEQDDTASGVITLSNADGVELVLDVQAEDDISGVARVGDKQVGTVSTTSDGLTLIRYNDGTFESLF